MNSVFSDSNKIVPVVVLNHIDETEGVLGALNDGGIKIAEITFRTACAKDAIALGVKNFPDMLIGAGTVINPVQCESAIEAGAEFIVSPGFSKQVLEVCKNHGVTYIPGAVTPTEIMNLINEGIEVIKFFPAEAYGGVKTLKALSAAFPGIKFMPTGGIGINNMSDYLTLPFIQAIGGSWMLKGTPDEIKAMSAEAVRKAENI